MQRLHWQLQKAGIIGANEDLEKIKEEAESELPGDLGFDEGDNLDGDTWSTR